MKKAFRNLAVASVLMGSTVFAGTFTDVPSNHWAYGAVEQLSSAGIIKGYKANFNGEEKLSRYEMAVIISRLLDAVGKGVKISGGDAKTLEKLVNEFSNELALLGARVDALQARTDYNEGRIDRLEEEVQDVKDFAGTAGNNSKFRIGGSLGFMWQQLFRDGLSDTAVSDPTVRLSVTMEGKKSDRLDWGIEFLTASDAMPSSSWRVFGDNSDYPENNNPFGSNELRLHKYFFHYKATDDLDLTIGKQSNPFKNTQLIFDRDVTPTGLTEEFKVNENVTFRAGQYFIQEGQTATNGTPNNEDAFLFAHQVEYKRTEKNATWIGRVANLNFTGEQFLHPLNNQGGGNLLPSLFNQPTTSSGTGFAGGARSGNYYNIAKDGQPHLGNAESAAKAYRLFSDFNLWNTYIEYKNTEDKENPWGAKFEYVINDGAWNGDDTGYWFEIYQGKLKNVGDWIYGYQYKKVDADAVLAFMNEDQLRSNTKGSFVYATTQLKEDLQWFTTYFLFEAANGANNEDKQGLFRTGLTLKF
jgi:hypothetical protein